MGCYYTSKKGRVVPVSIRNHAVLRFIERMERLRSITLEYQQAKNVISDMFNLSHPAKLNGKYKERLEKHGGHTLYFRNCEFVFVVENAQIVTIEIAAKGFRHLNSKEKYGL